MPRNRREFFMANLPKNTKLYDFKTLNNAQQSKNERLLVCPRCKEQLLQPDVEVFSRCPFCNYRFELNIELEDFILEPIVENWMRQQSYTNNPPSHDDFHR